MSTSPGVATPLVWASRVLNEAVMGFLALVALATAIGPLVFDVSPATEPLLNLVEGMILGRVHRRIHRPVRRGEGSCCVVAEPVEDRGRDLHHWTASVLPSTGIGQRPGSPGVSVSASRTGCGLRRARRRARRPEAPRLWSNAPAGPDTGHLASCRGRRSVFDRIDVARAS